MSAEAEQLVVFQEELLTHLKANTEDVDEGTVCTAMIRLSIMSARSEFTRAQFLKFVGEHWDGVERETEATDD